jgi:hypothetical protein
MERMDTYRRFGGCLWVAAGLLLGVLGMAFGWTKPGPVTWVLVVVITACAAQTLTGPDSTSARFLGRLTALLLALDFAGAVLDRFGVLGAPGSPGVLWGDWARFEAYTSLLLHDPGPGVVFAAAVAATALEVVLAVALASGWQRRWVGKAVAALFVVYLVAMLTGAARADALRYAMPVLIGGALLWSATPTSRTASAPTTETVDA